MFTLPNSYTNSILTSIKSNIFQKIKLTNEEKWIKIIDNLKSKLQNNFSYVHTFQTRITNSTDININKNEIDLLNKSIEMSLLGIIYKFNLYKPLRLRNAKQVLIQPTKAKNILITINFYFLFFFLT